MGKIEEEVKKYIQLFLKNRPDSHLSWELAKKYNLESFFNKQCQRYSISPETAKKKVITCRVFTNEDLEVRRKVKELLNEGQ